MTEEEQLKELFYKVQKGYHPARAVEGALEILKQARSEQAERDAQISKGFPFVAMAIRKAVNPEIKSTCKELDCEGH